MNSKYDPLYVDYLVYFNRDRDYFECHEVLEELWLAEDREPVYKGLLQVAVGMYHYRNQNLRGAQLMLTSAVQILEPYPEQLMGIELGLLLSSCRNALEKLQHSGQTPVPYHDYTIVISDDELEEAVYQRSKELKPNIPQRRSPTRGKVYEERMKAMGKNGFTS
ncbi:DUF309 domain-containing protein [Paenibacillus gallinarum]|uniref:DUF309 domain-containing protein n=1 Tax=Paenibacillus gallinarum TaxID=2762232 RepID=A0ABR8SUB4_9BACL|nr:DUF309 domain-containing protein [Paenibacillus gallinarum]MBD7967083.1 DUF309 domain-containing protein [Paenibacillus gallinarum]